MSFNFAEAVEDIELGNREVAYVIEDAHESGYHQGYKDAVFVIQRETTDLFEKLLEDFDG